MSVSSYISKQFSNPEGVGGRMVGMIMNRQNRPMYDETIRLLSLTDADSVLDIGCGNGFVLNLLARKHNASLAGIDTSESVIREAVRRNRGFSVDFSCQNASSMSFADGSFSKTYTINTVYFWDDIYKTMREIHRVLKQGGVFINTLYSNDFLDKLPHTKFGYRRYTVEELEKAAADAGFSMKAVSILDGAALCLVCRRKD